MRNFIDFMSSPSRSEWIKEGLFEIYVRKSRRHINGKLYRAFDISNINSESPGSNTFWPFVQKIENAFVKGEDEFGIEIIFVENVQNEKLAQSLLNHGFTMVGPRTSSWPPSFYKNIGK